MLKIFLMFMPKLVQVNYIFLLGEVKSRMGWLEGGIGIQSDLQSLLELLQWEIHLLPTRRVFLTLSISSPAGSSGSWGGARGAAPSTLVTQSAPTCA